MINNAIATQTNNCSVIEPVNVTLSINKLDNAIDVFLSFQQLRHNTPSTYKRALHQFFGWVCSTGRVLNALTRADVLQFFNDMMANNYSPNTINSYLTAIRRFYEFCELNDIAPNIAKGVKGARTTATDEHEKSDFTAAQAHAILDAVANGSTYTTPKTNKEKHTPQSITRRDTAIISLMMRCGLRTIEVVRANVGDIELMGDTYILNVNGKGDKRRRVPMTAKTWNAVNDYLTNDRRGAKDSEPLFTSAAHQCTGERLTTASVSRMTKKNIRATGINDSKHTAHSCRHTALGAMLEHSDDPAALTNAQIIAGHADPSTTMIYVKQAAQRRFLQSSPNMILDELF